MSHTYLATGYGIALALLCPSLASAVITGAYTSDANTLHLWHLDESVTPAVD